MLGGSLTLDEAKAWVLVISAIGSPLIAVITLVLAQKVHKLVNSAMTAKEAEIKVFQAMLVAKQIEIDTAEKIRVNLASQVASAISTQAAVLSTQALINEQVQLAASKLPSET